MLEGIAASIGSTGDADDNALAETTIGLFKTEAVGRGSSTTSHPMNTKPPTTLKPRHAARDASTMKPASNPERFTALRSYRRGEFMDYSGNRRRHIVDR
ncbi:MAG: hypothetical protein WB989_25530, partial [Mycobacterium sp.]